MTIIEELRANTKATKGLNAFGHGPGNYSEVSDKESSVEVFGSGPYPRVWVYPVIVGDDVKQSGSLEPTYEVDLVITDLIKLSDSPAEFNAKLGALLDISREYQLRLKKRVTVKSLSTFRKRPIYHATNRNLIGLFVSFKVELAEDITYPCGQ